MDCKQLWPRHLHRTKQLMAQPSTTSPPVRTNCCGMAHLVANPSPWRVVLSSSENPGLGRAANLSPRSPKGNSQLQPGARAYINWQACPGWAGHAGTNGRQRGGMRAPTCTAGGKGSLWRLTSVKNEGLTIFAGWGGVKKNVSEPCRLGGVKNGGTCFVQADLC